MMTTPPLDIRELVVRRRDSCVKFNEDKPRKNRIEAMDFYNGKNLDLYGDSGDGLSTVVSRDVMEAIEGIMPPLIRPFVAGEEVVAFDPVEPRDTEAVKQATEYVNHCFRRHNNVLSVAQTALKDGLLFRIGIAKTVMEEIEAGAPEEYSGLTQEELDAKRVEIRPRDFAGDIAQDPETGLFGGMVPPKKAKRYRVHIVAPDEFLYEERLPCLQDATFLGHRKRMPLADLIGMGIDAAKAKALDSKKPDTGEEQQARFNDETDDGDDWKSEDLSRPVWVDECYIRCDYQGDGVLVWRKVLLGGSQSTILSDEAADDHPYSVWTPIPMPHKLVGLSMFDITRDIQMQKTALVREQLNNLYLVNRPQREVLNDNVNLDDLLNPALNGIVRVKQMNSIRQLNTPFVAAETFGMVEYLDSQREARTGVTRYNQGMDSNSLNKTATGINIISSNSQQRQELIARQFGEFLKGIFQKLLDLVKVHAEPEEVARLTGGFVPWPTDYDATVSVGLGTNNKDQLVGHIAGLLQIDQAIIGLQQGLEGPLLTAPNVYEKLKDYVQAMGIKNDGYYTNPSEAAPMAAPAEEQEDPLGEAKIKAETEIGKAKIGAEAKLQIARMQQPEVPYAVAV